MIILIIEEALCTSSSHTSDTDSRRATIDCQKREITITKRQRVFSFQARLVQRHSRCNCSLSYVVPYRQISLPFTSPRLVWQLAAATARAEEAEAGRDEALEKVASLSSAAQRSMDDWERERSALLAQAADLGRQLQVRTRAESRIFASCDCKFVDPVRESKRCFEVALSERKARLVAKRLWIEILNEFHSHSSHQILRRKDWT